MDRFGDFKDPEGYTLAARRAAALGIEGKWAIHPSQITLANEVFSPPPAEVEKAQRIIAELEKAAQEGRGAASLDGKNDRCRISTYGGKCCPNS